MNKTTAIWVLCLAVITLLTSLVVIGVCVHKDRGRDGVWDRIFGKGEPAICGAPTIIALILGTAAFILIVVMAIFYRPK